jgi:hypothetical protein
MADFSDHASPDHASTRAHLVWRFRSTHHSCGESEMRTSEPKPHEVNELQVSFDSEVRKRGAHNDANLGIATLAPFADPSRACCKSVTDAAYSASNNGSVRIFTCVRTVSATTPLRNASGLPKIPAQENYCFQNGLSG